MDRDEIKLESQLKWLYLLLIAIAGLLILALDWRFALGGTVKEIGIAILAAAMLGATIDLWLKRQIVRDVFSAAFGYGQDIVNELRALSQIRMVVTSYSVDTSSGQRYDGPPKVEKTEFGQRVVEIPEVVLPENGTCDVEMQFEETKRRNDSIIGILRNCTRNPRISVSPCDGVSATVSFINRGKDQQSEQLKGVWVLQGTLLPFQAFQMRWWDKAQSAKWLPTSETKS